MTGQSLDNHMVFIVLPTENLNGNANMCMIFVVQIFGGVAYDEAEIV